MDELKNLVTRDEDDSPVLLVLKMGNVTDIPSHPIGILTGNSRHPSYSPLKDITYVTPLYSIFSDNMEHHG